MKSKSVMKRVISNFILLFLVACNPYKAPRSQQIMDYMLTYPSLSEKAINFETTLLPYNTFDDWQAYFDQSDIKLLVTVISDCTPCVVIIKEWDQYLKDNPYLSRIPLLFVASGNFNDYMHFQINNENNFDFPILLDSGMDFIEKNNLQNFPKEVFLLNADNEVVLVGSPLEDPQVEKYFKHLILNQ